MKSTFLVQRFVLFVLLFLSIQSCKKFNGIDNNQVITKPYSLYFTDTLGSVFHTNDGELYDNIFPPDGVMVRSIISTSRNIIMVKNNLHLSDDEGLNFNFKSNDVHPIPQVQQMLLEAKSHNRLYVASNTLGGISYSTDTGQTWKPETAWDINAVPPSFVNSFTQLKNNLLFAYAPVENKIFRKADGLANWFEVVPTTALPSTGFFFISHINNTLVAADQTGTSGVYYSNDDGKNWAAYLVPSTAPILSMNAPFDRSLLIGTAGDGILQLRGNTFVPVNNGLTNGTNVGGIAGAFNLFKNDADIRSIFAATTDGLFKSTDGGSTWILAKPGIYRSVY